MFWGGSRSTKPCVFPCKVAAAGDERYLVCAAVAAGGRSGRDWFLLCVLQQVVVPVCVVLCVSWSCGCRSHCNGCMNVAWAMFWGGSRSTKPSSLGFVRKTRRKTSIWSYKCVKIGGIPARNAHFEAPTCLVSILWFSSAVAVSTGKLQNLSSRRFPIVFFRGRRGAFWYNVESPFGLAGAVLLRRCQKISCIFRGGRSTLDIVILRDKRSTLKVCCCMFFAALSGSRQVLTTFKSRRRHVMLWHAMTLYTPHFTLYTPHSTLYTIHSALTLYTPHFTLHTLHSTLHFKLQTLHFTLHTPHFTLYFPRHTLHFTLRTPHSTFHSLHFLLYIPHPTLYTPHSILYTPHSTLHTPHFTLHTPHSTLYALHSTLYILHSTL